MARLRSVLGLISLETVEEAQALILDAYENDKQIIVMGNGGSASTASHFACDLGRSSAQEGLQRFRVLSLNDNMTHFSAVANDDGYENVFVEQLKNILNERDVVVVISASGNSPNVVKAAEYAGTKGAKCVAMVGFEGGRLTEVADVSIHVPTMEYGPAEDAHLALCHVIACYFQETFRRGRSPGHVS